MLESGHLIHIEKLGEVEDLIKQRMNRFKDN